jgi:hypothetical protein
MLRKRKEPEVAHMQGTIKTTGTQSLLVLVINKQHSETGPVKE